MTAAESSMTPPVVDQGDPLARATYRHLRLIVVALPALLLIGSMLIYFTTGEIEGSISAYYLGPIRDIFVGAMVGTAVALVAFRGSSPLEDYALNLAGFYAVFVAFIPTALATTLGELTEVERQETVTALRVTAAAVIILTAAFVVVENRSEYWSVPQKSDQTGRRAFIAMNVVALAFLGLVIWRAVVGDFAAVHTSAAVLLVASLVMAVWSHTRAGGDPGYRNAYRVIALLMIAGAPLLGVLLWIGWEHNVFAVEWYEMTLFLVFWIMETRRTWTAPVPVRVGAAPRQTP